MQVRVAAAAAAAALLEGPRQRAYLAIAEHREHAQLRCARHSSPSSIAWHGSHKTPALVQKNVAPQTPGNCINV